jgi:hypothetical protein
MKNIVMALAGLVMAASPALAEKVCIDARNIVSSKSTDGKTMVFKLKNGTTLVNHLQGVCSDLRYNGYIWNLRSGDTNVCESSISLRVMHSGQICTLGKFDAPVMEKHAAK